MKNKNKREKERGKEREIYKEKYTKNTLDLSIQGG